MAMRSDRAAATLWIVLLTLASTATTLVLSCATPFAALAAVHLRARDGVLLMLLAWAASQIVGFALLGHPHDPRTLGWAAGLAAAAVASVLAAQRALPPLRGAPLPVRLLAGYIAAFVAFTLAAVLCATVLGGVAMLLDPALLLRQFVRNGAILVGLLALYHGLVALGLPRLRRAVA